MPKRKRIQHGTKEVDPKREIQIKRTELGKKVIHGKKLLNRALKTARGFERQKLGKRIKLAAVKEDKAEAARLQRELDVLKALDLSNAVDTHINKTLLKSKDISQSGLLPVDTRTEIKKSSRSTEELAAIGNVTARLYNTKPVKESMLQMIGSINAILGLHNPAATKEISNSLKSGPEQNTVEDLKPQDELPARIEDDEDNEDREGYHDHIVEGASNEAAEQDCNGKFADVGSELESDVECKDLSRYDGLLASSSDEEDDDTDSHVSIQRPSSRSKPSQEPRNFSISSSQSSRSSTPVSKPPKPPKPQQQIPTKPGGSTFLPTLMGGYWSGSEPATDEDDGSAPVRKKNRPGQQARRAQAEMKFGVMANHLKGQKARDKDWDSRRGARRADERPRGAMRGGRRREQRPSNGEVGMEKPRARGMGKKDTDGVLHPSWEAARKAKEMKKTVAFEGKKVVFA